MKKFMLIGFLTVLTIILTGCKMTPTAELIVDDLLVQSGNELHQQQIIDEAVKRVEIKSFYNHTYTESIKGLDSVKWLEPGSYKMRYQACTTDLDCFFEDFEINIVDNLNHHHELPSQIHKVLIDTADLDIPLGYQIPAKTIIEQASTTIIDSSDQSFSSSLSITGLDEVDFNQPGLYKITIGGCDRELNCDETDTYLHVREGISKLQFHDYSDS